MTMKTTVVYAVPGRQLWLDITVDDGCTVGEAIEKSGILKQCPEIDLETQKVGVFGKIVPLDTALEEDQRIEIYRPITADPKTVRRRGKGEGDGEAEG
jgi:putative ubiquitin-RnfH superfamily antitoxin RatB of RatAB toxin-antitoxin module